MPFGSFIDAIPPALFLIIHGACVLIGVMLWRKARSAGNGAAARGFVLYILGELFYITYHLDFTTFLFAHTVAEVCDVLALLSIGMGITASRT